jgi:hypothetical protein
MTALAMAAVAAICVIAVWMRATRKSREYSHVTIIDELRDTLTASLARFPTAILVTVSIVSWLTQLAAGCAYAMLRQRN